MWKYSSSLCLTNLHSFRNHATCSRFKHLSVSELWVSAFHFAHYKTKFLEFFQNNSGRITCNYYLGITNEKRICISAVLFTLLQMLLSSNYNESSFNCPLHLHIIWFFWYIILYCILELVQNLIYFSKLFMIKDYVLLYFTISFVILKQEWSYMWEGTSPYQTHIHFFQDIVILKTQV